MRMFTFIIVMLSGCAGQLHNEARLGIANRELPSRATSEVQATGGRDVFNVSPNLAVSGGGGVVFLIACVLAVNWARTRRTLGTVVAAVEGLEVTGAKRVKQRIVREALTAGVADYLHGVVKEKSTNVRPRCSSGGL